MDPNTVNWDEIGQKIAHFLQLLQWGAYASIAALVVGFVNMVLLVVMLYQLNNRTATTTSQTRTSV